MSTYTNKLAGETSPYLLQHAHNPVQWYPWGEEALQKAKEEDKPILVSIGYAACHWCHVMEKESFEDPGTAALMNEHFVNIKIDREERPDLDHIYMDAVQAMTGSGGWPLNVFLTPDTKPFYGGTYFPPRRVYNRVSWTEVLQMIIKEFRERRTEIDQQSENLTQHLFRSNSFGLQQGVGSLEEGGLQRIEEARNNCLEMADRQWGGFGNAPKFPQTFTIQFLLRYYHLDQRGLLSREAGNTRGKEALDQALLSLDKMIEGGIYDQLGGGFARYATDTEWLVPHFEKMLYDNALLVITISEAYQMTGKERYREVVEETMEFVKRELLHPQNGFYAALDADSEGEEGKFYVWDKDEVDGLLGPDAGIFCRYYDITGEGNWEGRNILHVKQGPEDFAGSSGLSKQELKSLLSRGKEKLLEQRGQRVRPLLDDKIILGWNALMNTACSQAYQATGKEEYRQLAIDNMLFLLDKFSKENREEFYHTWKNDIARYPAFLDDYAFLIQALIKLYEVTADRQWLYKAKAIADYVIRYFSESATGFFYYTKEGQGDVIVRKKEIYDGAVPSGNAVMAQHLYRLSLYFDLAEWRELSYKALGVLSAVIAKYPSSFGVWNCLHAEIVTGTAEIAILGKNADTVYQELIHEFIPYSIIAASSEADDTLPLLAGREATDPPSIFLCKNFTCLKPVKTKNALISLIYNEGTNI